MKQVTPDGPDQNALPDKFQMCPRCKTRQPTVAAVTCSNRKSPPTRLKATMHLGKEHPEDLSRDKANEDNFVLLDVPGSVTTMTLRQKAVHERTAAAEEVKLRQELMQ